MGHRETQGFGAGGPGRAPDITASTSQHSPALGPGSEGYRYPGLDSPGRVVPLGIPVCAGVNQRGCVMAEKDSRPEAGAKGIVEDVKGKAKQAVGKITGKDDLQREGRAQQDKAASQREVAGKEAEAEKARGQAAADEARQRAEH